MRAVLTLMLIAVSLLAGCGGTSAPPSGAATQADPADTPAAVPSAAATRAPSVEPTAAIATPSATPTPTPAPTESPPVLAGTWVAPKDGAILDGATATLSARPTKSLDEVVITKVAFTVAWDGGDPITACVARKAGAKGAWSCKADLWDIGAPLGKSLAVGFNVVDDAGNLARQPDGIRTISFSAPPPKPTNVRISSKHRGMEGGGEWTITVRWREPSAAATGFRLLWVDGCPNYPAGKVGSPCLVEHTPLAASRLVLIKKVGGDARSVTFKVSHGGASLIEDGLYLTACGAIVLGATNRYGNSTLAIVESADVTPEWEIVWPGACDR